MFSVPALPFSVGIMPHAIGIEGAIGGGAEAYFIHLTAHTVEAMGADGTNGG